MLSGITTLSHKIFNEVMTSPTDKLFKQEVYTSYVKMNKMISSMHVAAVHYLPISMDEHYLQDSSFGTPYKKWLYFTRKDLEEMDISMKKYLLSLLSVGFTDDLELTNDIVISRQISNKYLYGYFRDSYIGIELSDDGKNVRYSPIDMLDNEEAFHRLNCKSIDISTHDKREELSASMTQSIDELRILRDQIKYFMIDSFSMSDLV